MRVKIHALKIGMQNANSESNSTERKFKMPNSESSLNEAKSDLRNQESCFTYPNPMSQTLARSASFSDLVYQQLAVSHNAAVSARGIHCPISPVTSSAPSLIHRTAVSPTDRDRMEFGMCKDVSNCATDFGSRFSTFRFRFQLRSRSNRPTAHL